MHFNSSRALSNGASEPIIAIWAYIVLKLAKLETEQALTIWVPQAVGVMAFAAIYLFGCNLTAKLISNGIFTCMKLPVS